MCVRHAAPSQYGNFFYRSFQHYTILCSPGIKHVWVLNEVICNIHPKKLWVIKDETWRHCLPCNGVLFTSVLAVYIFVNNQLDAQFFMYVYLYTLHVSSSHVRIIKRIIVPMRHLVYITLCRWPSGMQEHMLLHFYVCFYTLHVSSSHVPIIRRIIVSMLHLVYVTLRRWPSGMQEHMLLHFSCMFVSILYMFRAAMCPSSGELLYQCDTWFMPLCVDDRPVCRSICSCLPDGHLHICSCIPDGHLHRVT